VRNDVALCLHKRHVAAFVLGQPSSISRREVNVALATAARPRHGGTGCRRTALAAQGLDQTGTGNCGFRGAAGRRFAPRRFKRRQYWLFEILELASQNRALVLLPA